METLIPENYGDLESINASIIMEEINRAGGNSGACYDDVELLRTTPAKNPRTDALAKLWPS